MSLVLGSKSNGKKGNIVSSETITWIIYISIFIAAVFAVRMIISKAAG